MEGTKISFQPTYSCQTTQTKVMMPNKSPVSHTVLTWSIPNLLNTKKEEDLTESMSFREIVRAFFFQGFWVFIVTQGQTLLLAEQVFSLWGRYSLMRVYSRILFMLRFYKPGLFVCRKYFPFKVPWRPHNNGLDATWPFGLYMPRLSVPPLSRQLRHA